MSYLTVFQTEGLGWTAALATTVLIVPRIIDFIGGVICGSVIAKTNMKWGKYRSWFVIGKWGVFAGIIMMFLNTRGVPLPVQILFIAVGYVLQNFPMNFIQTAQFGLMFMMGGASMEDRTRLSVATLRITYVGTILSSVAIVPGLAALTQVFGATDNPNWYHPNAYMTMAIITAFCFLIGCMFLSSAAKNYDKPQPAGAPQGPTLTIGDIIKGIGANDQLLVYVIFSTVTTIGMFAIFPLGIFYYMFVLGNMMLMPVAMTISTLFGLVAAMIGPTIGKKLGKKRALQIGTAIGIIDSALIAFLAGNPTPIAAGIPTGFVIYVALSCVTMIGSNIWAGFGGNYYVDIGEYGYWKSGKDNRAVAMGLGAMPMKIAMIVGGAIGGYGLHAIGYRPGVPVGPDFAGPFMLLLGGLPAAINLIGLIIFSIGYKITDADAAKYAKENMEKTMAAMGPPPPAN
jgi:Na+/melibiose symporter-like transporter